MIRKILIASAMIGAVAGPVLADNWDWIAGKENEEVAAQLEEQGFEYDGQSDEEDGQQYFWWHRKGFCVKFRSVDGIVADAEEVRSRECEEAS